MLYIILDILTDDNGLAIILISLYLARFTCLNAGAVWRCT